MQQDNDLLLHCVLDTTTIDNSELATHISILAAMPALHSSAQCSARHWRRSDRRARSGFSLLESVIAMTVFTIVALGITGLVIQARKVAENNILRNTAFTVAQGYLEQIRSISVRDIEAAIADPQNVPIPTKSVSATAVSSIEQDDDLFLDGPAPAIAGGTTGSNYKQILIDLAPIYDPPTSRKEANIIGYREVHMEAWFDLTIQQFTDQPNTYEIAIAFEYQPRGFPNSRLRGELRTVKANVFE